jgi:hypothetical protein
MTAFCSRILPPRAIPIALATLFAAAGAAQAGTLSGTVVNRTTGKPEPNITLDLLSPTAGMAEVATTKSDAQGHFSVTKDAIGTGPILIRATFHDVSFNTFAPPGRPSIDVEVFDISKDPKSISVRSHVIIFEPQDGKLVGAEEYEVENGTQPPSAYFRTEGNFDFAIPESGKLQQVSTVGSMGMSVAQASIDKGKGHFAIAYAFRPGQTNVRLSYELPYAGNAASLQLPATYPGARILVVVPPGVTVSGDGLTAAGQEQGMMVYTHDALPAKGILSVSLSGVGTPAAAGPGSGDQGQAGAPQEGNSRQGGPEVIAAPSRLDPLKWYVFAGLAALFVVGALLVWSKKIVVPALEAEGEAAGAAARKATKVVAAATASTPAAPVAAANISAEVNHQVAQTMESLKEQIFKLELRRQAGTISEDDYLSEKARIDQLLRDLVQG